MHRANWFAGMGWVWLVLGPAGWRQDLSSRTGWQAAWWEVARSSAGGKGDDPSAWGSGEGRMASGRRGVRKKRVPPDNTRGSRRLSDARRFARNDNSPEFRLARNDNSRVFRRPDGWVGLVGHAEWPARSRSEDRPLHAERIRC